MSQVMSDKQVLKLSISFGDSDGNMVPDVQFEVSARLPKMGQVDLPPVVENVPVEAIMSAVSALVPMLPAAAAREAAVIVAVVQAALKR